MKKYISSVLFLIISFVLLNYRPSDAAADESANPFQDVKQSDWAYQAVVRLHDEGYLKGYPDEYFRGNRALTRYEMATMIDRVTSELEYELKNPGSALKVTERSLADARNLIDQYGGDIKDLKARLSKVFDTVDKMQIHGFYYVRAPGTYTESVMAYGPDGTPLPPSIAVSDGRQSYVTGTNGRGTGVQVLRMIFSGNIDKQSSYNIRLENKNYFGQTEVNGLNNTNFDAYNKQGVLRINFAYIKHQLKNVPMYVEVGKYNVSADLGLSMGDNYYNGGLLGWNQKYWNGYVGFGQNGGPDLGTTALFGYVPTGGPQPGNPPNTVFNLLAHTNVKVTPQLRLGANYVEEQGYPQAVWSTRLQNFVSSTAAQAVGSLSAVYAPTHLLQFAVEGLTRFGKDPTTGSAWRDNKAVWAQALIGKSAPGEHTNYAELGFIGTGYNSTLPLESFVNGTPFYPYYYSTQTNDRHLLYAGLHHWLNPNLRLGLVYLNWGLNVPLPLAPNANVPRGSYMTQNDNRALFWNTQMSF